MDKRDYYEVLGVSKDASDSDIKSAFRKAAKQYHPDLHPDDKAAETKFKEANEAYEVLSDKNKRAQYDQFGHAAFDPSMGGGSGGAYGNYSTGGFGDIGDIFESIFGGFGGGFSSGTRQQNRPSKGRTLRAKIDVSFEEAAFGVEKKLNINKEVLCPTCKGSGAAEGTSKETCSHCQGRGQVRVQQKTPFGVMSSTRTCEVCGGTGTIIKDPCKYCKGIGRVKKTQSIKVRVPAGIDDGQIINIPGEGEPGNLGGPYGDLQVIVTVKPHKKFVRDGYNILQTISIPYYTAVLGGDVNVETLDGMVKYEIPAGTQIGTRFRLRDKGIQVLNSRSKGDMIVTVTVDIPKRLNDEQRECIEALAEVFDTSADAADKRKTVKDRIFKKGKK